MYIFYTISHKLCVCDSSSVANSCKRIVKKGRCHIIGWCENGYRNKFNFYKRAHLRLSKWEEAIHRRGDHLL
jgi:hypothetical protein